MVAPNTAVFASHIVEEDWKLCNWTRLNSQPVLKLAQNSLIKIMSNSILGGPETLYDFYKFGVCALPLS